MRENGSNYSVDKGSISRIFKELKVLSNKKTNHPVKR